MTMMMLLPLVTLCRARTITLVPLRLRVLAGLLVRTMLGCPMTRCVNVICRRLLLESRKMGLRLCFPSLMWLNVWSTRLCSLRWSVALRSVMLRPRLTLVPLTSVQLRNRQFRACPWNSSVWCGPTVARLLWLYLSALVAVRLSRLTTPSKADPFELDGLASVTTCFGLTWNARLRYRACPLKAPLSLAVTTGVLGREWRLRTATFSRSGRW